MVVICFTAYGQQVPFDREIEILGNHVRVLADDEMQGRATGTEGEQRAARYIKLKLEEYEVAPGGEDGYFQSFPAFAGRKFEDNNSMKIQGDALGFKSDYFPLEFSANGDVTAKTMDWKNGKKAHKAKGKIAVIDLLLEENEQDPHGAVDVLSKLRTYTEAVEKAGGVAVIFINSGNGDLDPQADYKRKIQSSSIPVLFVEDEDQMKKKLCKETSIAVEMIEDIRTGRNVIGKIDNGADKYIVIGAHYDHLGYGEFGSLHGGQSKEVHNGADDNASGTAIVLELARSLASAGLNRNYNYLFILFSGEEMGLLGSKYFVENPSINLKDVSYMLNLDMVGRMKNKTLIVNGTGTSPEWGNLLVKAKDSGFRLELSTNESGIGPSDHTSFYLKDIPVLAFFTGTHNDYHKPGDDVDKLNYFGMFGIQLFIQKLITESPEEGQLAFTKTKDPDQGSSRMKFKVTLGVLPSYSYPGPGMQIDGVTDGNPAQQAGLKAGDIIIGLGENEIEDIYGYMDALSKFKKGDETKVKVKRGDEALEFDLKF